MCIFQERPYILADTLSRLIDTDPDLKQQPQLEGHEFGKYCFETLPKASGSVHHENLSGNEVEVCEIQITYDNPDNLELSVELPLEDDKFVSLQQQDPKIRELHDKVKNGMYNEFYLVKNNVLLRSIVDNGHKFEARVILDSLVDVVLHLGHNQSGHNGYQRTYAAIKASVLLERNEGANFAILQKLQGLCALQKVQKTQFEKQNFKPGVQPMEFISMDLIGEFQPPSSKGNRYALTACLYAYRLHILHTTQEQNSRRDHHSLEKSHHLSVWCLQKTTDG